MRASLRKLPTILSTDNVVRFVGNGALIEVAHCADHRPMARGCALGGGESQGGGCRQRSDGDLRLHCKAAKGSHGHAVAAVSRVLADWKLAGPLNCQLRLFCL